MSDLAIIGSLMLLAFACMLGSFGLYTKHKKIEESPDSYRNGAQMQVMMFGISLLACGFWLLFMAGVGLFIYLTQNNIL